MEYRGIFDTHAHYDDAQFDASRAAVIETQRACGIAGVRAIRFRSKSVAAGFITMNANWSSALSGTSPTG